MVSEVKSNDDLTLSSAAAKDVKIKSRNTSYTWPTADGTAAQFLQTNGSGTLSWAGAGDPVKQFCGSINLKTSTPANFILSKKASMTASNIRSYELHFWGVSTNSAVNTFQIRILPYNNGSSVSTGNQWNTSIFRVYQGGSTQGTNYGMNQNYMSPGYFNGSAYPYASNTYAVQDYNGNAWSPRFYSHFVYENNLKASGYQWDASTRTGNSGNYMDREWGIGGAAGNQPVSNYADAFYVYNAAGNFTEGIVALYAITV